MRIIKQSKEEDYINHMSNKHKTIKNIEHFEKEKKLCLIENVINNIKRNFSKSKKNIKK